MAFLTFVIPTRKRHRELSICVSSIAEQVGDTDTNIIILYNSDEEHTARTVERLKAKYPIVSAQAFKGEPDYTEKFHAMFLAAPDSEWVWTFGDDELLRPGGFKFIYERLKTSPGDLSFVHISEKKRSTNSGDTFKGRFIDLCSRFGWLDMCGFISGNIIRGKKLASCVTQNWKAYAKTAYVQACALLEGLKNDQAKLIDSPVYDTQGDVDEHVVVTKMKQWADANTVVRYLYLSDALQLMYEQGILKDKLPPKFFRYHHYHLWDRHICCFLHLWISEKNVWFDEWALYAKKLSEFVDDKDVAASIISEVNTAQRLVLMQKAVDENAKMLGLAIEDMHKLHNIEQYKMDIVEREEDSSAIVNHFFKAA